MVRWVKRHLAVVRAVNAPDHEVLAFTLPGNLRRRNVEHLARNTFGHRAEVLRHRGQWIVRRRPFVGAELTRYRNAG